MKFLINFWDYCFYRPCGFYKRYPLFSHFIVGASNVIGVTHMVHITSLTILWSSISGRECSVAYPIVGSILLMFYYDSYVYTEEKYKLLAKKYKKEKNKKIKGWGVFLYILISFFMPFILFILLGDKIHIYIPDWLRYFNLSDNRLKL